MDAPARVLVIDDEDTARQAVAAGLREAGFDTLEAADGSTGLDLARTAGAGFVILDLMLPDLPGEQLLRELRRTSSVPVIVVSAKREEDDRIAALDLGADDYLVKPFTLRELLARIRAVLRRSESDAAPVITVGQITIDGPARIAMRAGQRVPLTTQEFAVLDCLIRHRGRIVTRGMLDAAIHPGESPPPPDLVSNIIDVLVLRLRKKIGHDLITTRRGQGFIVDG